MKKQIAMLLTGILSVSLFTACGGAPQSSAPAAPVESAVSESGAPDDAPAGEIVITLCDSQPETSLIGISINQFGEYLQESSDGRITLQFYPSAMLGNGTTCMQQVQLGTLDMYRCDASALYDFGVDSMQIPGLPYLFKDSDQAFSVANSAIGDQWLEDITESDTGFVGIGYLVDMPRCFFTRSTPITTLADCSGLKIRSLEASLFLDYKTALGLNPVPIAWSEVYTSLSTGVIDAAANTLDSFVTNKLDETCKYFINNNGMIPVCPVVFSAKTWANLSPEDQQLVVDCWARASQYYHDQSIDLEARERAEMEAKGVTFCDIEDMDSWIAATQPVVDKYSVGYESVVEEIRGQWMNG